MGGHNLSASGALRTRPSANTECLGPPLQVTRLKILSLLCLNSNTKIISSKHKSCVLDVKDSHSSQNHLQWCQQTNQWSIAKVLSKIKLSFVTLSEEKQTRINIHPLHLLPYSKIPFLQICPKTQGVSQIMGEVLASRHLPLPLPPTRPAPHAPPPPFLIIETLLLLPQLQWKWTLHPQGFGKTLFVPPSTGRCAPNLALCHELHISHHKHLANSCRLMTLPEISELSIN